MLGEFVYVVFALVAGMAAVVLLIGGVSPFVSTTMTAALVVAIVLAVLHHIWYARNREEIEHDPTRLHARERRGF